VTPSENPVTEARAAAWDTVAEMDRLLFDDLVCRATASGEDERFEEVLAWCSLAAGFAATVGSFGALSSRELEDQLLRVARRLPAPPRRRGRTPRRWLHVLTEAYATFGHTNLCRRWIQLDRSVEHDVVLLEQRQPVPENLVAAVRASGGHCRILDPGTSRLERAVQLRHYAWEHADVVVLHTHPADPIAVAAFGIPGGPPVVVLNHAGHLFWIGAAVADLVLDIRMSDHVSTRRIRGITRATILPILLPDSRSSQAGAPDPSERRSHLRRELAIPEHAVVLLTVGSPYKYQPMAGLDFVATAEEIIRRCDDVHIIAIGPTDDGAWLRAREASRGRICALGYRDDSAAFNTVADIYLDAFPLGSSTALLEAAESGLPCVLPPSGAPPLFRNDDYIPDKYRLPRRGRDYIGTVQWLVHDAPARETLGLGLQAAVRARHCEEGWRSQLERVKREIPVSHGVHADFAPGIVDPSATRWLLEFTRACRVPTGSELVQQVFAAAWRDVGGCPKVDGTLWRALKKAATGRPPSRLGEAIALRCLNRRIRGRAERAGYLTAAREARLWGSTGHARRLLYRCLIASPGAVTDSEWIKEFAKAWLGRRVLSSFKRLSRSVFSRA